MLNEKADRTGHFIALEGVEGSGKSTQAKLLAEALRVRGFEVVEVKEPGGTDVGLAIREIFLGMNDQLCPEAEVGLLLSAKAQLIHKVILPALAAGKVVICDRFTDSLYAYQCYAKGIPKTMIDNLLVHMNCLLWPDLSIHIDISPETSASRVAARRMSGGEVNAFDLKSLDFIQKTRDGIKKSYRFNDRRFKLVMAVSGDKSIEEVHKDVMTVTQTYFWERQRAPL